MGRSSQRSIGQLNGFFDFVLGSALMDQLTEYNAGVVEQGQALRDPNFP
jgi:hypothetical protein